MDPFNLGKLAASHNLAENNTSNLLKLAAATPYPARLITLAADGAMLLLQSQQGQQRLPLNSVPAGLPQNVPLQLSFTPAPNNAVELKVMQWHGAAQAVPLTPAQAQLLQQPAQIQQLAQQIAQGEAIRQLAGDTFKVTLAPPAAQTLSFNQTLLPQTQLNPAQGMQLVVAPIPAQSAAAAALPQASLPVLVAQLKASAVFQLLNRPLQQLLLQPEQQVAVLQQLQSKAPVIQLGTALLPLTPAQRQPLLALLLPLVKQQAATQLAHTAALLLIQPLKALPAVQLNSSDLARSVQIAVTAVTATTTTAQTTTQDTVQRLSDSVAVAAVKTAQPEAPKPAQSITSLIKDAVALIKEDVMKAVNLEKIFSTSSTASDSTSLKIQPGVQYFGKLQLLNAQQLNQPNSQQRTQQAQLLLQTAQGPIKLPLAQVPAIPAGVPLQLSFKETAPGVIEIQLRVLTALPQSVTLSSAQAQLLQDPKQLAQLQQQLGRGEPIVQLAGEPIKLPVSSSKLIQLQLQPPTELKTQAPNSNQANSREQAQSSQSPQWQLSIQPIASEQKLQLSNSDFLKPLPLATANSAVKVVQANSAEISNNAWRQLLPLLQSSPATLRSLPEMPAAVQQIFSLLRQAQPDGSKVLSTPQVVEQLQAALQFQPTQIQPNMGTAAGTLAVAIQLLLGHLLRQPLTSGKAPAVQRLAQSIGQLDTQQSGQLLRALGSHSSALQLAQLQNADTASVGQQWLIPLALQQQQESRLSQILIEQREAERKDKTEKQKYWQLTMKFDLGSYGQLMAVAKLRDTELQLQFYTDEPQALRQAEKFLPLLTERCTAQGLNISKAQCQLGKIPDTLGNRRTSLISTKA